MTYDPEVNETAGERQTLKSTRNIHLVESEFWAFQYLPSLTEETCGGNETEEADEVMILVIVNFHETILNLSK